MSLVYLDSSERDKIFAKLRQQSQNDRCIECQKKNTKWASINLGLYLCYDCSGKHRQFGPKLSLVRSLTLDSWHAKQILFMENGGNQKFMDYMRKHGGITGNQLSIDWENNPQVKKYKQELQRIVENIEARNKNSEQIQNQNPEQKQNSAQKEEEEKQQNQEQEQQIQEQEQKKKEEEEKQAKFNNNLSSNNNKNIKTNNVVFASKKNGKNQAGKKIKAEKIDDFDWDSLTFDDGANAKKVEPKKDEIEEKDEFKDFSSNNKNDFFSSSTNNTNGFGNATSSQKNNSDQQNLDKYKSKDNCTSISSSNFFQGNQTTQSEQQKYNKFQGSQAISSNMFFDREEEQEEHRNSEKLQEALYKAKDKASELFGRLKQSWK